MIKKLVSIIAFSMCVGVFAKGETHSEVALRIVQDSLSEEQLRPIIDSMAAREIYVTPSLKPYKSVIIDFYTEMFSSDEFIKALAKINTEIFTLEELLDLEKMMALPIYKTHQEKLPEYLTKLSQLSIQAMLANQFKLQELLKEAQEKNQEGTPNKVQKNILEDFFTKPKQVDFPIDSAAYTDDTACSNAPSDTLVGTWAGEWVDEKTGDVNKWTTVRHKNGKMSIEFITVNTGGVIDRFTEEGLWSYSGCLYTAIIKKVAGRDDLFQEVYRVHEINDSMMRYSNFRVGKEFTVTKVK